MDSYRILLSLHIVAVILGLGITFAYPFIQAFAEKTGVGATRFVLRWMWRTEHMVVYPGAALVAAFGIGLIFEDVTGYKDDMPTWLMIAIAWYVLAIGLAVTVQRRNLQDALKAIEGVPDAAAFPAAYLAVSKRIQMVGGLLGLSIIGIAFMMVWGRTGGF